jgi:23S rRNA G2445 N2-methylase RlmL
MAKACRIWARVVHGLEWMAAAEASLLPGVSGIATGHRDLLFDCEIPATAELLRTVDDIYILWGEFAGIGPTRQSLAMLADACRALFPLPVEMPTTASQLRVTASFLGRRTYSRFEIEDAAGPVLAAKLGLDYARAESATVEGVVWARLHLAGEEARLGLRLAAEPLHRRPWRTGSQPGALHPPVAAAMALLADLAPGQTVLDPCCGSGTLLIEAGLRCAGLDLQGCDIAPAAVAQAQLNATRAGVALALIEGDATAVALPQADRILANPPWDRTVAPAGGLTEDNLLAMLLSGMRPQGRAVLLADQALALPARLAADGITPLLVQTLRVSGRLAELIVVGEGPRFAGTELGRALAEARPGNAVNA